MTRSYYYLGGDELHTGMYVALIRRLEKQDLTVHLVARVRVSLNPLADWRTWRRRNSLGPNPIAAIRERIRGEVHPLPLWAPWPALSVPFFARFLRRRERVVMHTRQIVMGRLALAVRRWWPEARVISEMEGDPLAELRYNRIPVTRPWFPTRVRWKLEDVYYTRQERRLVHESDAVLCVSSRLRDLLIERYRLNPAQAARLSVFPSVGDPGIFHFDEAKRRELRQRLGIDGRYVVLYSGNLGGRWQVPDKLVEAFGLIRRSRPDAYFLILTPEKDRPRIQPHIDRARLAPGDYGLHSCPHDDVVRYLCAADLGLLLRERHLMNEVAAPGKFSEYMLTGVPTIMTEGIGDFSAQVREERFACVLPDLDRLEVQQERIREFCARPVSAEDRLAQGRWAAERFSTELRIPQLAALYRRL